MINHLWQPRTEKRTVSVRVNRNLWKEFQKRSKALNCRTESDLLEYILKKALYPPDKLYKVICAEMVETFDWLRGLKEEAEREARITQNQEENKPLSKF